MTTASAPKQDAPAIPKSNAIRRFARLIARHKPISTAIISGAVAALVVGSFFAVTAIQHGVVASDYRSATTATRASYAANTDAYTKFVAMKSSATDYQAKAMAIADSSTGYVDADARTSFATAVTQLGTALHAKAGAATLRALDGLGPNATTDQYAAAARHLAQLTAGAKKEGANTATATSAIQASSAASDAALLKLARTIDGTSETVLAANAKADPTTQQAFTAAAKAVTDAAVTSTSPTATPTRTSPPIPTASASPAHRATSDEAKPTLLALVTAYLANGKALTDAQAAAVAAEKAAADAAAQQAAQDAGQSSYVDPDGNTHSTPTRSGGGGSSSGSSSSGSSGGSGGGPSGGGSSSSGGGSSGPSHEKLVDWGSAAGGCSSGNVATYVSSAPYGGYISVHDNYLTTNFTDTGSGWTVTGNYCVG